MQIRMNLLRPRTERRREIKLPPMLVQLAGDFFTGLRYLVARLLLIAIVTFVLTKLLAFALILGAVAAITGIGYSIRNTDWFHD